MLWAFFPNTASFLFVFCLLYKSMPVAEFRSIRLGVFCKKAVPRSFAEFTEKHLCQSLLFNSCRPKAYNFIKKETLVNWVKVISCEITPVAASKNS